MVMGALDDAQLKRIAELAREKVHKTGVGPMHSIWDAIFDAEAHIEGREAIVNRIAVEKMLQQFVGGDEEE